MGKGQVPGSLRGQHPEPVVLRTAVAPHRGQLRGRVEHELLGFVGHLGDQQHPGAGRRLVQDRAHRGERGLVGHQQGPVAAWVDPALLPKVSRAAYKRMLNDFITVANLLQPGPGYGTTAQDNAAWYKALHASDITVS